MDEATFDELDNMVKHIPKTIVGTLQEVLDNSNMPNGRILNALDLSLCQESTAPAVYSTDTHAWHLTRGRPGFPPNEEFPTINTRWALVGSANTMTFLHVDSDGFNTYGLVISGGKLWIFYREHSDLPLSSRQVFLDDGFHLDRFKKEEAKYGLEVVYLKKGDLLYVFSPARYTNVLSNFCLKVDANKPTSCRVWQCSDHHTWWSFLSHESYGTHSSKHIPQFCNGQFLDKHIS